MTDKVFFPQPIVPVKPQQGPTKSQKSATNQVPFNQLFQQQIDQAKVKFSNHAQQRLAARNINLSPSDIQRINEAVDKAALKGSKDSLILMDNLAFVVSVKNKTVITAVDGASMKDNVFSNIDSAVII